MEEIEVGDYVRTRNGDIGKVLDITNVTMQKRKKYLIKWNISKAYYITAIRMVKHSKNITDLIEEGDILRIKVQYHHKIEPRYILEEIKDKKTATWKNLLEQIDLCHYEIIEILTKEQYDANCYRLEE